MLKFSSAVIWRLGKRTALRRYSSPSATVHKTDKPEQVRDYAAKTQAPGDKGEEQDSPGLVAAAFAALNSPEPPTEKKPSPKSAKMSRLLQLDNQIVKASDVDGLLKVAENPVVSRRHALKMVSVLSDWSSTNKVKISDFEKDPRFLKLCRILARTPTTHAMSSITMADDLSTVLGITGDDEAARLICNLTLPQLVKVLKALQQKGRRSTPLLRALSHNIVKQSEPVDLKKCADILYCVASLNFPDPMLMERICSDVITNLSSNADKAAVVHSIMTSLGLLRYRHEPALAALAAAIASTDGGRPGDVASAIVTLATVNYQPPEAEPLIEAATNMKEEELPRASSWLELVFSLLVLGKSSKRHLQEALRHDFIEKLLATGDIPVSARRKLMAIDAYISLAYPSHTGPRLPPAISEHVPLVYSREKSLYVSSVLDTFRHLVSAEGFMRKAQHQDMGFLYDGEFALDANCRPVPLDKAENNKNVFRIAILSLDYHDMSRRSAAPAGPAQLATRLLELKGYKVLQVPYTEFNPKDKLVARVQYIETQLKKLVGSKPEPAGGS